MEQQHISGRQDKQKDSGAPVLEWIAAGIGLVLTLAMLGFIGWQAWKSEGEEVPGIEIHVQRIVPAAGGWVVEIAAQNVSAATAAAVQIEGELIAKSTGAASAFQGGQRVFHTKFGPGTVAGVDGNKLTVDFDKAGRKMVLDSFLQPG